MGMGRSARTTGQLVLCLAGLALATRAAPAQDASGAPPSSWMPSSLPLGHSVPVNGSLTSALLALQPRHASSVSTSSSSSSSRFFRPNASETEAHLKANSPSTSTTTTSTPVASSERPPASQTAEQRVSRFQASDIDASGSNINEMVELASLQNVRHKQVAPQQQHQHQGIVDSAASSSDSSSSQDEAASASGDDDDSSAAAPEEEPRQQLLENKFARPQQTAVKGGPYGGHLSPRYRQHVAPRPQPERRHQQQQAPNRHYQQQQKHQDGEEEQQQAQGRREQEAAEASEADLINKSALDEQRQQQREIIAAQAASDARAIKEQQELLLKQQLLQQQMISRRHQELEADRGQRRKPEAAGPKAPHYHNHQQQQQQYQQQQQQQRKEYNDPDDQDDLPEPPAAAPQPPVKGPAPRPRYAAAAARAYQAAAQERRYQLPAAPHGAQLQEEASRQLETAHSLDNHFSDQLDLSQSASLKEEVYDFSLQRKPATSGAPTAASNQAAVSPKQPVDLQPEAQRSFETTAQDTVTGQHKDYFQFAESYKKGQFHSGYKRGGNNLQVSGHASQHVNQAEGHNKWKAPKGRGSSYWELKHGKKQQQQQQQRAPEDTAKDH